MKKQFSILISAILVISMLTSVIAFAADSNLSGVSIAGSAISGGTIILPIPTITPKPIPSPIPKIITLLGIIEKTSVVGYEYQINVSAATNVTTVVLTGAITGIGEYIGKKVYVTGMLSSVTTGRYSVMNVTAYKPVILPTPIPSPKPTPIPSPKPTPIPSPKPTPIPSPKPTPTPIPVPIKLTGIVAKSEIVGYKFQLNPLIGIMSTAIFPSVKTVLIGEVTGMEKYLGKTILVYGNFVSSNTRLNYRVFKVLKYAGIDSATIK